MQKNPSFQVGMQNAKLAYAKRAARAERETAGQPEKYIPGLTPIPAGLTHIQVAKSSDLPVNTPKEIPESLVKDFLSGAKNPVSSLFEYCALLRLRPACKEVPALSSAFGTQFGCVFSVDGIPYPQGVGRTKKDAKNNAAKIALSHILELVEDDVEDDEESGSAIYDNFGRRIVINADASSAAAGPFPQPKSTPSFPDQQNHVKILKDFCAANRIAFELVCGDTSGPFGFMAKVVVDGEIIAEGSASTKAQVKKEVAAEALPILQENVEAFGGIPVNALSKGDRIANLCYQCLFEKLEQFPDFFQTRKYFAAFVVKRGEEDEGEVVALGTGNRCIAGENLKQNGRSLVDSYALTIARRSLLKYFHKEMKSYLEGNKVLSIFEETADADNRLLKLKEHISIHLFLSDPPCGDYARHLSSASEALSKEEQEMVNCGAHFPNFTSDTHGQLTTKNEDGLIEAVEPSQASPQKLNAISEGEDFLIMSCSDKILQWNILGLQGALFSNYTEPIYLTSITLEKQFDHGHFARTACCRVYDVLATALPPPFKINHPWLQTVTLNFASLFPDGDIFSTKSVNWSHGDEKIEIIECCTGITSEESPFKVGQTMASRLCKAGFLHRYRQLATLLKRQSASSYVKAKEMAVNYQKAKHSFRAHCIEAEIGHWVSKPVEVDMFFS